MVGKSLFNKYFMCHFGDDVNNLSTINNETLQGIWKCQWQSADIEAIFSRWLELSAKEETVCEEKSKQLLCDAVQLILVFVQHNFTGPFTNLVDLKKVVMKLNLGKDYEVSVQLSENGEEVNPNVQLGEFIVLAKRILLKLMQTWPDDLYLNWWHLRLVLLQQQILDDLTSNLYNLLKDLSARLKQHLHEMEDVEEYGLLALELANAFLLFRRTQKSNEFIEDLCQRMRVDLDVRGLLGLRTKFQQKALPQLCLQVKQEEVMLPPALQTHGTTVLPKLLLLDDDTRLERIRFIEPRDNETMTLPSILQALVLTKVNILKRSQPQDRLADEELEPYIQTLIYQEHGPLQVRQSALLLNCVQESTQRRTVERSWKQCEEAVKLLSDDTSTSPSVRQRLSYAFAADLATHWQVQKQLCRLLRSLGMSKTALDIYLKIHAWPEVIECYNRLELRHKAAEVIREQLAVKPTVLLYCLLGDATDDVSCYETAWEFSKQSSGKAQAYWGLHYYRLKEYAPALEHLRRSVEINSLQEAIWLRLGYSAIMLERWEDAVQAYLRYTHLEPNGFESWNNLAKALIKLGDKKRAHKVLGESLKCNYNNWKVWENFMLVSVDTGYWEDTLNAYSRLSELKERFIDVEVLGIVINAIVTEQPDANEQTPERLKKKANTLMGHQCVKHGNVCKIWELAALLANTSLKKAQKLNRAYRAHVGVESTWAFKQPEALKALTLCREICTRSLKSKDEQNEAEGETKALIISQLNSARITAQGCIRAVEKDSSNEWHDNQVVLSELKELLDKATDEVKKLTPQP